MTVAFDWNHLETHDGAKLFCQHFPAAKPLGVLITVHDYAQHSGVYSDVHTTFARLGYSVYTTDLRGHGKSGGERAAIDHFDDYLDDLDLLVARVRDREAELPIFLLGQGVGALIALRFVTSRKVSFHGLILCGGVPLLPTGTKEKWISSYASLFLAHIPASDEARELLLQGSLAGDLKDDPLIYRGGVKAKTVAEINAVNSFVHLDQQFLSFPVLCVASERHHILMEKLHDKLLTHDKTLIDYEGESLTPLLGEEREKMSLEIAKWCGEHLVKLTDEDEGEDPEDDSL